MAVIIDLEMPRECDACPFEDRFGGCILMHYENITCEESEQEWHQARLEHRRLKWCPLKDADDLELKLDCALYGEDL